MCKIISFIYTYILSLQLYPIFSFNTTDTSLLNQNHGNSVGTHVGSSLKNKKSQQNHGEDDESDFNPNEDDEYDEKEEDKEDDVDAELDKIQEKEEEEEKMLEDAEDVGVKESIEEEKSEEEFVNEKVKEGVSGKKDTGRESLRYLMDEMVRLSLELKEVNINYFRLFMIRCTDNMVVIVNYDWFDHELPVSKLSLLPTILSTTVGSGIGALCSLVVNCALVELSTSSFFTLYFGITFMIIGFVILWRLSSSNDLDDQDQRKNLKVFGFMIIFSGILCFFLRRNWFISLPRSLKTLVYTLQGVSTSFALTFTIVDSINYFMATLETTVSKPFVESRSQVHLILLIALVMGGIFGFTFGLMDVEDEAAYHVQLALMKEEKYTYPIGIVLGGMAGFGNEYLRQQESWRFNRDNAYDVEI